MINNRVDINSLLGQMREMKSQATGNNQIQPRSSVEAALGTNSIKGVSSTTPAFGEMLSNAVNSVNSTQKASGALSTAYATGDPSVSLSQVMVASQKSSVAFQAMTQVRNKVVEAYQSVMNMPI
ncbi:MAG: flagellar hook-basal body complex protein FliE [Paraglaciecola psychrophila]|jgi:flagellar hook-basal body complex protein FliE